MARQSDHLAEEMSRFEQEILGGGGSGPPIKPLMSQMPPQARPPGPPPGMPPGQRPGPPQGMPPRPPPGMPPGPPRGMPPGPPRGMPPGPPRGMPPGVQPFHGQPPGFNGLPPRPLLESPHSGPPLRPPPGPPHSGMPPRPPHGGMPPGPPPGGMPPGPPHGGMPPGPPHGGMPPGPPGGMPPGQFRPPPPNSAPVPLRGPPPKGASAPLLPQPPPTAPVPGHTSNAASIAKPTPSSIIPQMVPPAVAQRQVAVPSMTVQPSLNETAGATTVPSTTKIFPAPTRPLKTKRDPKKLRLAGGQVWQDHSLDDWDQNDFRIFCGDLGNDVNDDTLARAFSRFPSFIKAKVIRDKYTKKTKGYGFVSFKDPHDFMQAMREMNGRYIGNRPVKLRKSTWRDRCFEVVKKRDKEKKKLGFK